MIWVIIRGIIGFIEICIFLILMECFESRKPVPQKRRNNIIFAMFLFIHAIIYFLPMGMIRTLFSIIMYIVLSQILYEGTLKQKIKVTVVFFVTAVTAEGVSVVAVPDIIHIVAKDTVTSNSLMVLIGITAKTIQFIGVNIINRIKNFKTPFSGYEVITYMAPLSTIFALNLMIKYQTNNYDPVKQLIGITLACIALLVSNVFTWMMFESFLEQDRARRRYGEVQEKIKMQYEYYRNIEVRQEESRKMWHDINNHLSCIGNLISSQHPDEARDYLSKINVAINRLRGSINTGNVIVDTILNEKYEIAQNHHINMGIEVDLANVQFLDNIDSCTIYSNLIDNAIEACLKLPEENREIMVMTRVINDFILIKIINTASNKVKIKNNRIVTTKTDKNKHGIGLSNVGETVKKYEGIINLKSEEDKFTVQITFPQSEMSNYVRN